MDKVGTPETDRARRLDENPSDDAVREYYVAALKDMGADEAVIVAAQAALRGVGAIGGARTADRNGQTGGDTTDSSGGFGG